MAFRFPSGLRRACLGVLLLAVSLIPFCAEAQNNGVVLQGPVTPGHIPSIVTNGILKDGGTAFPPMVTAWPGVISTNQQTDCIYNAPVSGPYASFCLGITPNGDGWITLQSANGAPPSSLNFVIDGVTYQFPGSFVGSPDIYASSYGVSPSNPSNDADLALAASACTQAGTRLILPTGSLRLTGTTSITLKNCAVVGAGNMGTASTNVLAGTTFLLTSTSVTPFVCSSSWSITGVNFFWPGQLNGTTVYPALITDAGSTSQGCRNFYINNVTIFNAYDGIVQSQNTTWGEFTIENSFIFGVHSGLSMSNIGDFAYIIGSTFDPGPWLLYCNFTCNAAVTTASANNTFFNVGSLGSETAGIAMVIRGTSVFGWKYGFYIQNGGQVALSDFDINWGAVGTILDSSSGGVYAGQNSTFKGFDAGCSLINWATSSGYGNAPCFNLGPSGALSLTDFVATGDKGSFILSAGAAVSLNNVQEQGFGQVADGSDYYFLKTSGTFNSTITVQNSQIAGLFQSTHTHGINNLASLIGIMTVQDNLFQNLNDDLNIAPASKTTVTGNVSINTQGAESFTVTGGGYIIYKDNTWDKPPTGAISLNDLPSTGAATNLVGTNSSGQSVQVSLGTGVVTALGDNVGSAGAFVVNGGALGTPSSGNASNLTALNGSAVSSGTIPGTYMAAVNLAASGNGGVTGTLTAVNGGTGITSLGTGVATALGVNTGSSGGMALIGGAASFTTLQASSTVTFGSSTTSSHTQTFTNSPCTTSGTTEQWIPIMITGQTGSWYVPACQ